MKQVDLSGITYLGADIVPELIKNNLEKYAGAHVTFRQINLISDNLSKVDLILCRDCLVHLSFADVLKSLNNVCASQSEYLLSTTFPSVTDNKDIITGQWRPINLMCLPISLPKPIAIINETAEGSTGKYSDKALGLWRISDVRKAIRNHG